jgi:hypothetical protein
MAGELRDFDPDKVTIHWVLPASAGFDGGTIPLHVGLIDGPGAISDAQDKPRATRRTDRQGNQVRNKSKSRAGQLTLTYQAESQTCAVLTGLIQAEDSDLFSNIGAIVVRNLNGDELVTYAGCAIDGEPNVSFGDTNADRAYVFGYAKRKLIATGLPAVGG